MKNNLEFLQKLTTHFDRRTEQKILDISDRLNQMAGRLKNYALVGVVPTELP